MKIGTLEIELMANIARLQRDMNQVTQIVSGSMTQIQTAVAVTKAAIAGLVAGLAVKTFAEFTKATIDSAASLHDMSIQTGASVAALMQFKDVAATSDTTIDGIAAMMNILAKNMAVASEESKGTGQAIAALGLDFNALQRMSPEQKMLAIAKALDGFQAGAGKSAVAMTLFGKEGAKALPFLADLAGASGDVAAALTQQEIASKTAMGDKGRAGTAMSPARWSGVGKHITGVADRTQQRFGRRAVDFLAQAADVHVDDIGLRVEMVVPYVFQQHRARHDLVGMAQQVFEQLEFTRL
jgi:hypothetical protein